MTSTKILLLVCAISIFVSLVASESESDDGRQKRAIASKKKTVGAAVKKANCKAAKFSNTRKCCAENVGGFFHMSKIQSCSPITKLDTKLMAYSSYNLNSLFDKNNNLNLDDPKSVKDVQTVACVIECLFKDENLLNEAGKINVTLAAAFLEKAATDKFKATASPPATDAPIMELISTGCGAQVETMNVGSVTSKSGSVCSREPMMFLQCVRQNILSSCPPTLVISNTACDKQVELLNACSVFNTTVTYK